MSLNEEVNYLIINHDYSEDGVHSLTPTIIALILNEAKGLFHDDDKSYMYTSEQVRNLIEQLKVTDE